MKIKLVLELSDSNFGFLKQGTEISEMVDMYFDYDGFARVCTVEFDTETKTAILIPNGDKK